MIDFTTPVRVKALKWGYDENECYQGWSALDPDTGKLRAERWYLDRLARALEVIQGDGQ